MNTGMLVRACMAIEQARLEVEVVSPWLKPTEVHFDYETFAELERSLDGLEVEELCGLRVVPLPVLDEVEPHERSRGFRLWMPMIYVSPICELKDAELAR